MMGKKEEEKMIHLLALLLCYLDYNDLGRGKMASEREKGAGQS